MKLFEAFGDCLNYEDILQLDGAFSVAHANYGKSPLFNDINDEPLVEVLRKRILLSEDMRSFIGVEGDYSKDNRELLWKGFWLEYINAFDKLTSLLPNSIATAFVGRQTIEIGFKYLLLKKNGKVSFTHDLGELSDAFFSEYKVNDEYMRWVDDFCKTYCKYIEGKHAEYFRYPEYQKAFFAGNCLDIKWLSYNFALILLKLIHFAGLDTE
jgi:hypothetical protein